MERRKFIATAGLVGILAAGTAPAVRAGQTTRWRLASRLPGSMEITHSGLQDFILNLKAMSDGKFEITLQSADEVTSSGGVLDSVQRGSVECGHTSGLYYVDKDETFALDSAIPFGLNARQMSAWMQYGQGLELLREFYLDLNIVNFPMGNTGAQMGGWYRKPIRSPADLKGLRMRMLGLGGRVLERLGGKAVYLPSGETINALRRGNIDAAEWSAPHDDLRLGLPEVSKQCAYPGWWKGGVQFSLYVNRRAYEALTDENRALLESAAATAHLDIQAQYDARNPPALRRFLAMGVKLTPQPKAVMDAAYRAVQELYADLSAKNPRWKKIYTSYAAFLREQSWGWGHTEIGFDSYLSSQQLKTLPHGKKSAPAGRR